MKISIVTISFNQCRFLKECIESVLSQKNELALIGVALEYIIVDPGSTDGSRELIESYGDDISTIFEKDEGPADGLNRGFSIATGDMFGYLNADDEFTDGCLSEACLFFSKNKAVDVVSGHGYIVDEFGMVIQKCFSNRFSLKFYSEGLCVLVQPSTFFTSSIYHKCGGFNDENNVSWDGELAVDMGLHGAKFARVNTYWSKFRVYNSSISGSGDFLDKIKDEHLRISNKIGYGKSSYFIYIFFWLFTKLIDPKTSFQRILDGLIYGKRVIPS